MRLLTKLTERKLKMADVILTQEKLKNHLHYNPLNGLFTWIKPTYKSRVSIGSIAGNQAPDGYIIIKIFGQKYPAHRLAWFYMTGEWPANVIDHINCIRNDNVFSNIRLATYSENQHNRNKFKSTKSGLIGAKYDISRKKYKADIRLGRKTIFLGRFDTAIEAHNAYITAKRKYHPFSNF